MSISLTASRKAYFTRKCYHRDLPHLVDDAFNSYVFRYVRIVTSYSLFTINCNNLKLIYAYYNSTSNLWFANLVSAFAALR
jgi:hypothetical protein